MMSATSHYRLPADRVEMVKRSLRQLAWTLEVSVGQFKLILVRCNYSDLRRRLIEKLKKICSVSIQVIQLQESQRKFYSAITEEIEADAQLVMVVGLETVGDLPQMLTNANQVREEFRKNLSLPIVLWINHEIHASIMQVAPDFESWATTRSFVIAPDELVEFIKHYGVNTPNGSVSTIKSTFSYRGLKNENFSTFHSISVDNCSCIWLCTDSLGILWILCS
ncbi:hypothetical protein H6G76_16180 [Nostoc sp. FACHB-152]|uniref:hypothetical protein n=1 Tax=unclassified Nostoc TaxID=2593658 RepID=UPI0016857305|nr:MULTISPECIES: hypothetical protein [unclassified Nostoc]MBD2448661.1 hypothetical protein [Nostoc sp. FACHB-152]MBD2468354.1 hypothetical protein [Nostoc sp. FACHB-145]